MHLEASTQQRLARRTDGRVGEHLERIGIETLDGVVLLREVLVVIGVESRMALHQHSVAGDEVEV